MNKKLINNFILDVLNGYKFRLFIIFILYALFDRGVDIIILPYILKLIGDNYSFGTLTITKVIFFTFSYAFVFCLKYLVDVILGNQIHYKTYIKIENKLREKLFNYITKHSMSYFNNNQSGIVSNKFDNVINSFKNIHTNILTVLTGFVILFILIIIYSKINLILLLILLFWSILFLIYNYYNSKIISKYEKNIFIRKNVISGTITDDFINISNIKSNSTQRKENYNVKKQGINILYSISDNLKIKTYSNIIMFLLMMILFCSMLGYTLYLIKIKILSAGTLVFVSQNIVLISFLLRRSFKNTIELIKNYSQLMDGLETLIQPYEIVNNTDKTLCISSGKIEFKNIKYGYKNYE